MPRFQDPHSGILMIAIQSFLIRQNGLTVLVDSCSGNDKAARERLALASEEIQRDLDRRRPGRDIDIG